MYKVINNIPLTKNFKLSEFECHDGNHEVLIDPVLLTNLQMLREMLAKPIFIAAAYRNEAHNRAIGGSPNSQHMSGKAVDIKVANVSPKQVAIFAERCGFRGIGVYVNNGDSFTHCDVRPVKSFWQDQKGSHNLIKVTSLKEVPD